MDAKKECEPTTMKNRTTVERESELVMHEVYPSKEALDAVGTGAADGMGELFSGNWMSFSSPRARAQDGHESSNAISESGVEDDGRRSRASAVDVQSPAGT
jgi:hypothetical protein